MLRARSVLPLASLALVHVRAFAAPSVKKSVFVTGANSGIGLALCKQLVTDYDCQVFLGARNEERGTAAVESVKADAPDAAIQFVKCDTNDDASVTAAAEKVKASLGSESLWAIVNNAGTGLAHGGTAEAMINTNLYGPKRVCEAFIPLLDKSAAPRIVNVGSVSGPLYLESYGRETETPVEIKKALCDPAVTWDQIEECVKKEGDDVEASYGLSKAALSSYTMILAREMPEITCSTIMPGIVATAITAGMFDETSTPQGKLMTPEEGTFSIRHCLFDDLDGNGWYYGADAKRSPLHFARWDGEPEYDGAAPSFM
jgi:NAD(P)-dependent dehydrogenase (short-subunit alcohol dehydrogenase family)